jgi:fructoselysine-6-P-deglycase FrlB-like protein
MTHFLSDILRQPRELQRVLGLLVGHDEDAPASAQLKAAVEAVFSAEQVYLTGIGSSWHAALNVGAIFSAHGRPVYLQDAAELLQFATIPENSALIVISRSGRSIEIVQLLDKAAESRANVVGITNAADGDLARRAQFPIVIPVEMDHAISVNTYTTLALAAGMLAATVLEKAGKSFLQGLKPAEDTRSTRGLKPPPPKEKNFATNDAVPEEGKADPSASPQSAGQAGCARAHPEGRDDNSGASQQEWELASSLSRALSEVERAIPGWQEQIEKSAWLRLGSTTYFLARGSSLGSAFEARLMWEEGVKTPATAMGAASFRHGPQEIVGGRDGAASRRDAGATKDNGMRFGIWIDAERMREEDLALALDLRRLGAKVMLIGQNVPADAGDLVFNLPAIPGEWQFLIDIIPAQLTAERLARLTGVDPDTFRLCSFVVEDDAGLLGKK